VNTVTVGELIDEGAASIQTGPFGTQLKAAEYTSDGRPLFNVRNVGFGEVRADDLEFVSDDTAERLRAHILEAGDIVFGRKGAVERHAFIPLEFAGAVQGSDCIRLRLDHSRILPRFASFALRTRSHLRWMQNQSSHGATMASLNQEIVRRIELPELPLDTQSRVVEVLGALDDLIESNRRLIALLEQMAQAIYLEWFVRFRYPGHEEDELVDSPVGPVPARFDLVPLGACCNINREQRRPEPDEEIVYIDISALGDRTVTLPSPIPGSDAPGRARRVLSDGDIVWSMVRPGRRAHALLVKAAANWIGSTGLAVISPNGVPSSLVFEFVSTSIFSDYLVGKEQGAAYPAVRPIDFEQAQIAVPPTEVIGAFDDVVSPIHGLGWELAAQARAAAQLRDLLLPKLVTGAIDLSHLDLDALLEESAA
jgi:type I restriction enzyme, S subunit